MLVTNINKSNLNQPKYEKSKTGKLVGGLAGVSLGALSVVIDDSRYADDIIKSTFKLCEKLKNSSEYGDTFNKLIGNDTFCQDFIKKITTLTERCGKFRFGCFMLGLTTLGLTIGAITDAIVNGIRNKKADKLEQQQKLVTEQ